MTQHTPEVRRCRTRLSVLLVVLLSMSCTSDSGRSRVSSSMTDDTDRIAAAFANRESGIVVESTGTVIRLLADDTDPPRHQRFIVRLRGGHTVLISHNLDLAERVPVELRRPISFRGQYEWNERGGVVHWTHHDPDGRRPGGWLEYEGRRYR